MSLFPSAPQPSVFQRRATPALSPVFLALLALLFSLASAWAAPVNPDGGGLLLRSPEPGAKPISAPLLKTDIDVKVSGPTLRATVTQAFRNTGDAWVEGTYLFPLPEDAAVDGMKLVVGDRVIVADIRERIAAKRAYEAARAEGKAAALTEQERPNMFTNAVANIGPGETVLVQITYQQTVPMADGHASLRLPFVVGPRYSPSRPLVDQVSGETAADPVPDRHRIAAPVLDPARHTPVNPVTVSVHLHAGFPIASVTSATHRLSIEALGPDERRIALADGATAADRDVELTWTAAAAQAPTVGLFKERVGEETFLLALVTPPNGGASVRRPRDVTFVIDNSGSMAGASMRQAKASLLAALGRLDARDRFNVIRFDDTLDRLFPESVPADEAHLRTAEGFVGALEARGGTEMLAPLKAALADAHPEEKGLVRQVVFLTDGAIGNEDQIFRAIAEGLGRSRLFMIGIGSAPNGHLMRHAAEIGRGSFTSIGSVDQVSERTRELFAKLENAAVTELSASFSAGAADVTPGALPDLYRGEPLVFSARLPEAVGSLTVRGLIGGKPWTRTLLLAEASEGHGISKAWARARIGESETARITGRLRPEQADADILRLALAHGLTTRLTSLVAIDATPRRPAGTPLAAVDLPLNLPAGWDFSSVFGREGARPPASHRQRRASVAPLPVVEHASLALPQTAEGFAPRLLLGLMLLALGLLVAPLEEARAMSRKALVGKGKAAAAALLCMAGLGIAGEAAWIPAKAMAAQILLERAFARSLTEGRPVRPWASADTEPVARLSFGRESYVVLRGASGQSLAFGPAQVEGTPEAGEPGTTVYAAHRDTQFSGLGTLRPGDVLRVIRRDGHAVAFRVTGSRVARWDGSGLDPHAPGRHLALTTCWPLDGVTRGPMRLIVEAEIDGDA